MTSLGELISRRHGDRGIFVKISVHWGDIAREILDEDPWAIHHMTTDDYERVMLDLFKRRLNNASWEAIRDEIKKIIAEEITKGENKLMEMKNDR